MLLTNDDPSGWTGFTSLTSLVEKAKLAFLGEMAARIAHNVKNPLSSMKTLVQLLEEDSSLPERVRHDCRMVVAEIDRLNANISQVLRYAKPSRDAGGAVDLGEALRRIVALTRPEAERRRVKLEFAASPCSAMVEGGNEAVDDILSNLLVNALEASPAGGTVRIGILLVEGTGAGAGNGNSRPGGVGGSNAKLLELTVEDQGAGVAVGLRHKIFQPFFTTRPAGTGLGLAIVERRVDEIGGAVECQSPIENGRGTRFLVRFQASAI